MTTGRAIGPARSSNGLARDDPRLTLVRVAELPAGWLGKTYALQSAADVSSSDWLLFTDADVVFAPGTLRRAVGWALRQEADFVAVAPDVVTESFGERLFVTTFGLIFALHSPPWRVIDRGHKAAAGVGAFNLVRAEAFHAIGGFAHIALSVDDDMRLAQALKFAGYRTAVAMGHGAVSVRWQVGLGGMVRGLEKNFFAAMDYRTVLVVPALVWLAVLGVMPYVGLFVGPWWTRLVCAAGVASVTVMLGAMRNVEGFAWYYGLVLPLGMLAVGVALVRSAWLTLWRGGVRSRDHLYPLAELQAHTAPAQRLAPRGLALDALS